jgi:tetratricopeptide (TPR) repeat protein
VADSLKEKLKCLVFIPIISRTYCDPKSFAWEHEFKAFIEQATHDQFGMKVKLPNGNVASRVLPIRIHELDSKDLLLCESALGTYLRGVEFIYKEPGVNRPLKANDNEKTSLNKTIYRNQINRVANAVQEIISGLISQENLPETEKSQPGNLLEKSILTEKWQETARPAKTAWQKIFSGFVIAVLLILAGIFFYPKVFKKDRKEILSAKGEITVAVMPFQNLTNDATRNFWEVMVQDNLITSLSNARELKIRQTESVLSLLENADMTTYASLTPALARSISQKLDANVFVQGSINQVGNVTRLNARLIDSKTEEVFKSFQIEGPPENILLLSDSLSRIIRDYLIVELLKKELAPVFRSFLESTKSPEAFYYLLEGNKSFRKRDYTHAREMYFKALEIDSTHVVAMAYLASSYGNQGYLAEAREWMLKAYERRNDVSRKERLALEGTYAFYFETPNEVIKYYRQLLEIDDQNSIALYLIGLSYIQLEQYDKAIPELEKSLEINKKWSAQTLWSPSYQLLGIAYHKTGQFRKEQRLYKKAEKDFPDDIIIISRQAILALARSKIKQADEYLARFESIGRNLGASEASIQSELGYIYKEAGKLGEAEEYYRNALLLETQSPARMNNLAYLLIEKELNLDEGMELIEKALEQRPGNFYFLHTKGLGLYKQGKYQEALEILQQSWDIRMERARYNHEEFLHLEAAKKAVASMR